MKRVLAIVLVAATTFLCASVANAQAVSRTERKVWLNAVAANAAESVRTFTVVSSGHNTTRVGGSGYNLAVVHVALDADDGATNIGMACQASDDDSTLFTMQSCTVTDGVCDSKDASWSRAVAGFADTNIVWRVDITGYRYVSCTITITGGTANEDITASGFLTTN